MHDSGLARILRGRISCSREKHFTLYLYLAVPAPPNWFRELKVTLVSDDRTREYPAEVVWQSLEDTLVYGQLSFDINRFRRSVTEIESKNLCTFTPFCEIRLSAGDSAVAIKNQSSLKRFQEINIRPGETPVPIDPFDD